MKKMLCKPCAMSLESKGKTVKALGGHSEKIDCEWCCRRRYGAAYEVSTWPPVFRTVDKLK